MIASTAVWAGLIRPLEVLTVTTRASRPFLGSRYSRGSPVGGASGPSVARPPPPALGVRPGALRPAVTGGLPFRDLSLTDRIGLKPGELESKTGSAEGG